MIRFMIPLPEHILSLPNEWLRGKKVVSAIRTSEKSTTDGIITTLGRLGLREVPHLENQYPLYSHR